MKITGTIQVVFKPTETTKEKNYAYGFKGFLPLVKRCWNAYKSKPDKIMIFFERKQLPTQ